MSLYQKTKKGPKHITRVCINTSNITPLCNTLVIEKDENKEFIDKLEEIYNSLPSEVREKFEGLIKKYRNCMATSLTQLTTANLEPHKISTTTDIPIKLKPYKLSKELSDELKQVITKNIRSTLLKKEEDKLEHPICCISRTLSINNNKPIKFITD